MERTTDQIRAHALSVSIHDDDGGADGVAALRRAGSEPLRPSEQSAEETFARFLFLLMVIAAFFTALFVGVKLCGMKFVSLLGWILAIGPLAMLLLLGGTQ